ncbi:MAG: hypothetical protein HZA17_00380 [Nitrospirae bacterium]|nr:hypothetical protein [Nitrospirota bacterium]
MIKRQLFTSVLLLAMAVIISIGPAEGATINVIAAKGGTISPFGTVTVKPGAVQQLTITPAAGYYISGVTGCGGKLSGNIFTTGQVLTDCSVSATFAPVITVSPTITPTLTPTAAYTVTANAGTGGIIYPSGNVFVNSGTTKQLTVTPNADHAILSVTGCNGTLSGGTYTTGPVTAGCTVTASFKLRAPQISYFKINSDAADTTTQSVALNFNTAAGSMPTHYRASERSDFLNAEWNAFGVVISAPAFGLTTGDGPKTVYFQLKDSSTGGTSNVVSDTINLKTRGDFVINPGEAMEFANTQGFIFASNQGDANSSCLMSGGSSLSIEASGKVGAYFGGRCDFVLFDGRDMKEGWFFKVYDAEGSSCSPDQHRAYTMNERPAAGARRLTFKIHAWADSPFTCKVQIRSITLEGPVTSTDWRDAFR